METGRLVVTSLEVVVWIGLELFRLAVVFGLVGRGQSVFERLPAVLAG